MIYIILFAVFIVLDQLTKYWAVHVLSHMTTMPVIKGVFHFTYVENTGAAFGILQQRKGFLVAATAVILLLILFYIYKKRPKYPLFLLSLASVCAGAVGNLIDRVRLSYVIDFIDVRIIQFAVFNLADCFVVVGVILLAICVLRGKTE